MFFWKKHKLKEFIKSDTEVTLRAVLTLPNDSQKIIAKNVLENSLLFFKEIKRTPDKTKDEVIKSQLLKAQSLRYEAIENGAKSDLNPDWSSAALFESIVYAISGVLGKKASKFIPELAFGWMRSVLPEEDFEILNQFKF